MAQSEIANRTATINARAADWVARRDRGAWDDEDQAALETWLAQDVGHRVAWLRLSSAWAQADRLAALRTAARDRRPSRRGGLGRILRRLDPVTRAAAVVAACLALGVGGQFARVQVWGQPSETPVGGRVSLPLADGSRLELNTNTRLRTSVNGMRRVVWLDRGEAYFDVAPDPSRPFRVGVGGDVIRVVGTQFSVRRLNDGMVVRVVEGLVMITPEHGHETLSAGVGDEVVVQDGAAQVIRRDPDDLIDEMSWRRGQLVFRDLALAEVAVQFNRYNQRKLRVVEGRAATTRIGGAFDATNVAGFAALLRDAYGLRVEFRDDEILIHG